MKRLFAVLSVVFVLYAPAPAFAHADLIGSEPAVGAALSAPPSVLRLQFNEPVTLIDAQLRTSAGDRITVDATTDTDEVLVTPRATLSDGTYQLRWQIVSADGHPVAGVLGFAVGSAAPPSSTVSETSADDNRLLDRVLEGLGWLSLAGALAATWLRRRSTRTLAALALVFPALRLLDAIDRFGLAAWRVGEVRTITLSMLAGACLLAHRRLVWVAVASFALTGALAGHPLLLDPSWLMRLAHPLHLAGALLWSAAVLAAFWSDGRDAVLAASRRATLGIALLIPASVVIGAGFVFEPGTHGQRLRAKVFLVISALLLGAYHHWRLRRRDRMPRRMTLWVEVCVLALVAALSATLTLDTPERFQSSSSIAQQEASTNDTAPPATAAPASVRSEIRAELVFDDGSVGHIHVPAATFGEPAPLHVTLPTVDGAPLQVEQAEWELASESQGIFGLRGELTGAALLTGEVTFPDNGTYTLTVSVTIDTFTNIVAVTTIDTTRSPS